MVGAMERIGEVSTPAFLDFLITTGHSLLGLSLLAMTVWRFRLRRLNPVPAGGRQDRSKWHSLARLWHLALYLLIVWMAVTGALSYFLEFEATAYWHWLGKWILGILVIGHMLAALVHWLIFDDQVLQRMLGKGRDADTIDGLDRSQD